VALQILYFCVYRWISAIDFKVFNFHIIMMKYFPKVNDFILKKDEYGTTKTFKKNTIDFKRLFWAKNH